MNFEIKLMLHEITIEWLKKLFSLTSVFTFLAFMKMYKWLSLGPMVFKAQWQASGYTGYQVLNAIWTEDLRYILLLLPVLSFIDIAIKKVFFTKKNG